MDELKLIDSELWKTELLDSTADSMFLIDREGIILVANRSGAQRFGQTVDKVLGKCIFDFMPTDVSARRRNLWHKLEETKKAAAMLDERDGRHFETQVQPIFDANGVLHRASVVARDVTDRVLAERELTNREAAYRGLFENITTCVAIYDAVDNGEDFVFIGFNSIYYSICRRINNGNVTRIPITNIDIIVITKYSIGAITSSNCCFCI